MIWSRSRRTRPRRGDVRWCEDPRGWSGGIGGHHPVVLLKDRGDGSWECAVINTDHKNPVFRFSPLQATRAGVNQGDTIGPPAGIGRVEKLGEKKGVVSGTTCAEIEQALAKADEAKAKGAE